MPGGHGDTDLPVASPSCSRKAVAGSAVWTSDGRILAESRTVWITLDENQVLKFGVAR